MSILHIDNNLLRLQEKRSVKSITSDKSKNEKDSEMGKLLEEERKKNAELQKEIDLQVNIVPCVLVNDSK